MVLLLVMSICVGMPQILSPIHAKATTIETSDKASHKVVNGDFESGRDGYSVKNWSKTAMDLNTDAKRNDAAFLAAYSLETDVEASGNKVAALKKNGSGYVAVTSEKIQVAANEEYRILFDYRTVEISAKAGATNGLDYYGVRLLAEQFDASGTSLGMKRIFEDGSNTNQWSTGIAEIITKSNTASVVLYLWVGGQWNMYATVHFDNVVMESMGSYKVPNGTFGKVTYKADGGRAAGEMGPAGWTVVSCQQVGNGFNNADYKEHYKATVENVDGDQVLHYAPKNYTTHGYALVQSPYIAIEPGVNYAVQYELKMSGVSSQVTLVHITYYNAAKEVIGTYAPAGSVIQETDWTLLRHSNSDMKTPANTAYMKIGFYAGGAWNKTEQYDLYFDNVVLEVSKEFAGWIAETCIEGGIPRSDSNDFTGNYGIRQVSDGVHEEALQLYVTRTSGILGGAVYYSKPIEVAGGKEYTTSFDLKIENSDDSKDANVFGASYVLRYLDNTGNIIQINDAKDNSPLCLNGRPQSNRDWTHYVYNFTPPKNAVSVQVGLVIGGYIMNKCPNLTHSWDNLVLMEAEAYQDYVKDPAVTNSPLYKQTALFVGDEIGSGMAEFATSYSEMDVTNACHETVSVEDMLSLHANGTYKYVIISLGAREIKAQIPAGTVTSDTTYMSGVDFDTTTFAGLLEQTFAKVAEYHEPEKVVYVLPANYAVYKEVAEAASNKWGVELVVLTDTSSDVQNWNEVIEPAETARTFDCYAIPGMEDYLSSLVDEIKNRAFSFENMLMLDVLLTKVEGCPEEHAKYQGYQALVTKIQTSITVYDEYRPTICGATIADGDPNQLCFMAMSPKGALTEGITVKKMGMLVTEAEGTSQFMDIEAAYSKAETLYQGILSGKDVAPSAKYMAIAYVIYEENGMEYTFYSNNDYINTLGVKTAENGVCIKSVYDIAKAIAKELLIEKESRINFAAIGGVENKHLIAGATEDTEVSLYDVYMLVSENAVLVETWLSEGGLLNNE